MISVDSLDHTAGKFSLSDISFDVGDGETLVVLGPTGAGKTVLLELLAGFRRPRSGNIRMGETDVTSLPPEKRGVGFVYQDYLLFPHLSVSENIAYGLEAKGVKRAEVRSSVDDLANQLGISQLLDRRTRNLSGGEQQRIALARALITKPKTMFLDEPFAAVDPNTKEQLMRETSRILASLKIPVIYVTHDQVEATEMADRIAVMNEGRIVQLDLPERIFSAPKTEFVANFVGTRNIYNGVAGKEDGRTTVEVQGVKLCSSVNIEGSVHVTVRPEDILISSQKISSSARNSLKGRVTGLKEKGPIVYLTANCGIEMTAAITRESFNEFKLTVGDEVYLTFKAASVNLF